MTVGEFLEVYCGIVIEVNDSNGYVAKMNTENFGKYFGNYKVIKIQNLDDMVVTIADE